MTTPLISQEIFLLERYISLDYFDEMREAWRTMVDYTDDLLNRFMNNIPADYRNRKLPEQPDIVWGERVLPNFRSITRLLDDAFIKLSHGDLEALGRSSGVTGGIRGQNDFWSGWMNEVEPGAQAKYSELLNFAGLKARPIDITSSGIWTQGALTTDYDVVVGEPLNLPQTWPIYRLNPLVRVKSGDRVPRTGIYLPDVDYGFPTLLLKSDDDMIGEASEASVLVDPMVNRKKGYRATSWTLVERVADTSDISTASPSITTAGSEPLRAKAGEPCQKAGFWTSQDTNVIEHRYKVGEIMADLHSACVLQKTL
jgi:hypothetical protein